MKRYAGVLLSVTSLPSKYGIGCFDQAAYDFVDWLVKAGQRFWQILPLGATAYGEPDDSPYKAYSAFAGNPYMISLDALVEEGLLTRAECDGLDFGRDPARVDYDKLHEHRQALLRKAYERADVGNDPEFAAFCRESAWWLDDYALFMAVKDFFLDKPLEQWPEDIRMHWGFAVDYYNRELYFDVEFQKYMQYLFQRQWLKLKAYANARHIQIVGDMPIYVCVDGVDMWAHPELFQLDGNNRPTAVAGCPPDPFAADGQLWGNPLYRWERHAESGYSWWVSRMWRSFQLFDIVRIDHFRAFDEYFSIPADAGTAAKGRWVPGPKLDMFQAIHRQLGDVAVIAEDLGLMTDGVRDLVKKSGYPNMKVLQFASDPADIGGANEYLPHNYGENCVVYTGTHDNDTLVGWYASLSGPAKEQLRSYTASAHTPDDEMYKTLINLMMASVGRCCIIPIQDYLGLGTEARVNIPGSEVGNWRWRLKPGQVTDELAQEVLAVTMRTGRANWDALNAGKEADGEEEEKLTVDS